MANELQSGSTLTVTLTVRRKKDNSIVDVSGATTQEITIRGPHASKTVMTSAYVTDGTDGKITATFPPANVVAVGPWNAQGRVVIPAGTHPTSIIDFEVLENL
jgi:hypothetical protein